MWSTISSINMKNNKGSRLEPWGTPDEVTKQLNLTPKKMNENRSTWMIGKSKFLRSIGDQHY